MMPGLDIEGGFPIVFHIIHLQYCLFDEVFLVMPPKSKHDKMAMPKWSPDSRWYPCVFHPRQTVLFFWNAVLQHPIQHPAGAPATHTLELLVKSHANRVETKICTKPLSIFEHVPKTSSSQAKCIEYH